MGARTTIYSDAQLDDALDRAFDLFDSSYYDGFAAFAGALQPAAAAATESGGGSGGLIFLIIIVGIGVLIWWAIRRSNRSREGMLENRIDEVKAEIQAQLSEAANDILELEDDILLSENEEAKELYFAGSAGYAQFQEQLSNANSLAELDELAEGADLALWQLESAEALLESKTLPPKPSPRSEYQPPAPPQSNQPRHPELPEALQMRQRRRDERGSRPRQRSGGGLGGLGAATVILKSLQQNRRPSVDSRRSASRSTRSAGFDMPNPDGSREPSPTRQRRTSETKPVSGPTLKGRTRRKRK